MLGAAGYHGNILWSNTNCLAYVCSCRKRDWLSDIDQTFYSYRAVWRIRRYEKKTEGLNQMKQEDYLPVKKSAKAAATHSKHTATNKRNPHKDFRLAKSHLNISFGGWSFFSLGSTRLLLLWFWYLPSIEPVIVGTTVGSRRANKFNLFSLATKLPVGSSFKSRPLERTLAT